MIYSRGLPAEYDACKDELAGDGITFIRCLSRASVLIMKLIQLITALLKVAHMFVRVLPPS